MSEHMNLCVRVCKCVCVRLCARIRVCKSGNETKFHTQVNGYRMRAIKIRRRMIHRLNLFNQLRRELRARSEHKNNDTTKYFREDIELP